jgi:hypothetical protein
VCTVLNWVVREGLPEHRACEERLRIGMEVCWYQMKELSNAGRAGKGPGQEEKAWCVVGREEARVAGGESDREGQEMKSDMSREVDFFPGEDRESLEGANRGVTGSDCVLSRAGLLRNDYRGRIGRKVGGNSIHSTSPG